MFDPVAASLREVASGSGAAVALVALAGAVSSLGPCTAPRMVAIVSLVAGSPRHARLMISAAFVCGLMSVYAAFGVFASLIGGIAAYSHWIYAVFAVGMIVAGLAMLLRPDFSHRCDCEKSGPDSLGAAFLMGAGFAVVISPCCTPVVVAILAYCTQIHSVYYVATLLLSFGLGHAVPVIVAALASGVVTSRTRVLHETAALRLAGGTLMLALSGYYLCLV